jgi:MFS transporter, DHA1 family, tetracycline resistance protein
LIFVALWGIANPSLQAMMSHRIHASEQGQLQGALGSMRAMNGMIGPLLFTQVFALAVGQGGLQILGAPFLLAALLLLIAMIVGTHVIPQRVRPA